jgi:hypothetical protein
MELMIGVMEDGIPKFCRHLENCGFEGELEERYDKAKK